MCAGMDIPFLSFFEEVEAERHSMVVLPVEFRAYCFA